MANFLTVEGAQLFLNLHLRRNSFTYDFFNTGSHIYEDSSKINLELRLDCHLYSYSKCFQNTYVVNANSRGSGRV